MDNRVRTIRKELNLTQAALAKRLGIGKSALSMIETGKAALSDRNKNILIQDLFVNPEWIDKGIEPVFLQKPVDLDRAERENSLSVQSVPLYNFDRETGLADFSANPENSKPIGYIRIPNLPKCDGAMHITGDGMYPLLNSGDIVMFKMLTSSQDIFWGDMYLLSLEIDGEEYITVKYIQKSDMQGFVRLVSYNRNHADKDIEVGRLKAIAFVKATIRMNSLK